MPKPKTASHAPATQPPGPLTIAPLTPERWPDLEQLFRPPGAVGGCWSAQGPLCGGA